MNNNDGDTPFCEDGTHQFEINEDNISRCQHCGLLYAAYRIFKEELEAKAKREKVMRRLAKQKQIELANQKVQTTTE